MAQGPRRDHRYDEPGDNSQLGGGHGDATGNRTWGSRDIVAVTGLSLVALGQKGLVGVVDATIHDLWSHQVGSGEPGISGSLVGLMVFDTDPLVETRRRQIDEVHAPIVLRNSSQRGWFGVLGSGASRQGWSRDMAGSWRQAGSL